LKNCANDVHNISSVETRCKEAFPNLVPEGAKWRAGELEELHNWLKAHVSLQLADVDSTFKTGQEWFGQSGVPVESYIDPREYGETEKNGLNPIVRATILAHAESQVKADGSSGLFIDDINLSCAVRQNDS